MDGRVHVNARQKVAHQLVNAGVVAVIGNLNAGVGVAAAPIYTAKNIAQIAIATNPKFTALDLPTTFRRVASDTMQAKAIGRYFACRFKGSKYRLAFGRWRMFKAQD